MSLANTSYLDLIIFNNSFRYIGIPRTATQSIELYLTTIDNRFKKLHCEKISIVVIRNPLERLLSALRHNKDPNKLCFNDIIGEIHLDEHYLPFTEFNFFYSIDDNTIFLNYNNIFDQIKHIIMNTYNIDINDIEIPRINVTEEKRTFGCPYRSFINRHLKEFKKIYKNDIEFYNKTFKENRCGLSPAPRV